MYREKISVIIPNYNREELVVRAVNSALQQTHNNIEIIVVDDASTDNSVEKIQKINDERIIVITLEKNGGACRARNVGIEYAHGEYIAFLDSDDTWKKNKLERQLKFLEDTESDVVVSSYNFFHVNGNIEARPKFFVNPNKAIFEQLLIRNFITTGTILARKSCFDSIHFDLELHRYQDWDLALQIAKKYKIYFINEPLLDMFEQVNSITNSTSFEKKYNALDYIYRKYQTDFDRYDVAKAQILWSAGLYSLYTRAPRMEYLSTAVSCDRKNMQRKAIFFFIKMGGGKIIKKLYAKRH